MKAYAIIDDKTGEFHDGCSECGLAGYDEEDIIKVQLSDGHTIVGVTEEERQQLKQCVYQVYRDGKSMLIDKYDQLTPEEQQGWLPTKLVYKIDLKNASTHLQDRIRESFTVHIHGVFYTDTRPVNVLKRRL